MTFIHAHKVSEIKDSSPTAVAIGSFDGVHIGHQHVLRQMVAAAHREGYRTAVLTFFPHPKRVLQNLTGRYYLSTIEERVAQLAALGIDIVITRAFDEEVRLTRATDYVARLRQYLGMRQLWGGNFALGYQREGNIEFLRQQGKETGFTVELADHMVIWNNELVSSSRVRRGLADGDMEDVQGCLGRPYRVSGRIVQGDQRGRLIGFPTANLLAWEEQLLPANGVYATYAEVGGRRYPAATNVGVRPTVSGHTITVEAHLLDFDGDLYDQKMELNFVRRVRPERRFDGIDALKTQIAVDVVGIRRILAE